MKKKLALNTITSVLLQAITIICGFILPRLILERFGSEVNGLLNSITQFLGVVTLLDAGVGQVIQSALYKPLANRDSDEINRIMTSGSRFYHKIVTVLTAYVVVLTAVYPFVTDSSFDWLYSAVLILAVSVGYFCQYGFGLVDSLLLRADQKGYIYYGLQIVTLILNTALCVTLIQWDASIQVVKLASSLLFLMRPVVIRLYINRCYGVKRNVTYKSDPIQQKWSGFAQHISAFVLEGTDTIVLTLFSTLENVSVYAVYSLVANGVHQLHRSATAGIHAIVGDLWAKQEMERLNKVYGCIEKGLHFMTVLLFSCTGILIVPFIRVYTAGITDADYVQPLFTALLVLAHGLQCIRTVYNMPILGAGHYEQTQRCHIIAAALNLGVSVATVPFWGLIGVAIGTVIAIGYQVVWMAVYDSKHLLRWSLRNFVCQMLVDIVATLLIVVGTGWIRLAEVSYLSWIFMALQVTSIAFSITVAVFLLFYWSSIKDIYRWLRTRK